MVPSLKTFGFWTWCNMVQAKVHNMARGFFSSQGHWVMVKPKDNSKCSSSTSKARSSYERVGHNLISKYHNTNYKRRKT
jgi:hypothetical protein